MDSQYLSTFTFSSRALKLTAMASMFLDHFAAALLPSGTPAYVFCREAGRLAMPIFLWLLVSGFSLTRDVRRYFLRVLVLALVSEPVYDFTFGARAFPFMNWGNQNVCFSLALCLLALLACARVLSCRAPWCRLPGVILVTAGFSVAAEILRFDYGAAAVTGAVLAYLCAREGNARTGIVPILLALIVRIPQSEVYAVPAALLVFCANKKRGQVKYPLAYYAFYPLHLAVLAAFSSFLHAIS